MNTSKQCTAQVSDVIINSTKIIPLDETNLESKRIWLATE